MLVLALVIILDIILFEMDYISFSFYRYKLNTPSDSYTCSAPLSSLHTHTSLVDIRNLSAIKNVFSKVLIKMIKIKEFQKSSHLSPNKT